MPYLPARLYMLFFAALMLIGLLPSIARSAPDPESAAHHPYGYWIGQFTIDQGASCPAGDVALMRITKKQMIFVPRTGPLVLRGKPDAKQQHYHAEILKQDLNKNPFPIVFNATPQGDHFVGVYGSPTCRAHLTLTKTKMW